MKRVRWTCAGDHPGVLAPSRLRKADVRRYCWPCSQAAGVLVERTAPALERERGERQAAKLTKARRQRAAAKRRKAASEQRVAARRAERAAAMVDAVGDLRAELARIWPLACTLTARDDVRPDRLPVFDLRRRSDAFVSGWAYHDAHKIILSVGDGADASQALGTLAHEVAHCMAPIREAHGPAFWRLLVELVRLAYGADADLSKQTTKHGRQLMVEHAIRVAREKAGL